MPNGPQLLLLCVEILRQFEGSDAVRRGEGGLYTESTKHSSLHKPFSYVFGRDVEEILEF